MKLGLSKKIKKKQVLVFDWKESTSIEEEGKIILDLLSVIYDFEEKKKAFFSSFFMLYFLFILLQEEIDK